MQIVPALYIKDGKAAVYRPGDYQHIEFLSEDPYDLIERIEQHHIHRMLIIDVDASLPGEANNAGLLGSLSNTCVIDLEVGGGIYDMDYLKSLQYAGVDYFVLGSVVIDNFDFLLQVKAAEDVNNERILISLDVKDRKLWTHGWTNPVTDLSPKELIWKCINAGFNRFIITDVDRAKEGLGPDLEFYEAVVEQFPGATIGAGGRINSMEDIEKLAAIGISEVIVGNKIYKEPSLLNTISEFNQAHAPEA